MELFLGKKKNALILSADLELIDKIKVISKNHKIPFKIFRGGGITELGRGWEKVLKPNGIPEHRIHNLWIQPPIKYYHTDKEKMHINDIKNLILLIDKFLELY